MQREVLKNGPECEHVSKVLKIKGLIFGPFFDPSGRPFWGRFWTPFGGQFGTLFGHNLAAFWGRLGGGSVTRWVSCWGRLGGSLFVIQVGAGVASEAAWRLSAFVCVSFSARGVRVFPPGERSERSERSELCERSDPGVQQDRTGANAVASRSAVPMPLARVVEALCVCVLLLLCVSAPLCLCLRVRRGWRKFGEIARTHLEGRAN